MDSTHALPVGIPQTPDVIAMWHSRQAVVTCSSTRLSNDTKTAPTCFFAGPGAQLSATSSHVSIQLALYIRFLPVYYNTTLLSLERRVWSGWYAKTSSVPLVLFTYIVLYVRTQGSSSERH